MSITKYSMVSAIGEGIKYIGGIVFVDMFGFRYLVIGLILGMLSFVISYKLNKSWVFIKDDKYN